MAFLLEKPKRREIFSADFRDRVVHHVLAGHLEPRWERRFIHDSYACRKGKGTLNAVERLRSFVRKVTANGTRAAFYLQLDVKSFFVSLDRMVLWRRLMARERDPAVRWLTALVLFQAPTEKCRFRGAERSDFERLPPGKSLFHAPAHCGLPIGSLTSQFWANVYLDELDQFVKHRLKASFYVRYCNDIVLLSAERAELEAWERSIQAFLAERLHLELNQRRRLRPVSDGIDFLGFIVRADYLLVRRRVVSALRERLGRAEAELIRLGLSIPGAGRDVFPWPWPLLQGLRQSLNSSLSHLGRASSHRLILALRRRFHWLDEYFTWAGDKVIYGCAVPREAFRLSEQRAWFGECLLAHVLMIQQGGFWEVAANPPAERFGRAPEGHAVVRWPRRLASRRLAGFRSTLWESGLPVAWIEETGRRLTDIAERALVLRWSGGGHAAGPFFLRPRSCPGARVAARTRRAGLRAWLRLAVERPSQKWRTRGSRSSRGRPSPAAAQPVRSGRRPNSTTAVQRRDADPGLRGRPVDHSRKASR